jgi:hypothetical protein
MSAVLYVSKWNEVGMFVSLVLCKKGLNQKYFLFIYALLTAHLKYLQTSGHSIFYDTGRCTELHWLKTVR